MMNLKVVPPGPEVPLPVVGAGVAEESQEMIVVVPVRKAGTPDLPDLNYLRPKLMAVSDCFYTDSWKWDNSASAESFLKLKKKIRQKFVKLTFVL